MPVGNTGDVILLTGGAGFIGSHVGEYLLHRGDRVIVVDEMNDYYDVRIKQENIDLLTRISSTNFKFYKGDICNHDFMSTIFEIEHPTIICHLAARAGVRPSIQDPFIYVHSNVEGTTKLLDLARIHAVKNFVFASSSSVYGSSPQSVLGEKDAVATPVSPYAATKMSCELLGYTFHHLYGLNVTGLRFFTVYGPRGRPDMAPFKFIDRVVSDIPIQQFGDGTTSRDYTYISDIVQGVVKSIDTPLGYEIINLGNGRPFSLLKFIELVEAVVGKKSIREILPMQPGDVDHTCANIDKAKELLGYRPEVPFEVGIRKTFDWYKTFYQLEQEVITVDDQSSEISAEDNVAAVNSIGKGEHIDDFIIHPHPGVSYHKTRSRSAEDYTNNDLELDSTVSKATVQIIRRQSRRIFDFFTRDVAAKAVNGTCNEERPRRNSRG